VLKDRLRTADRLEERGLSHSLLCPLCCQEPETIEHITLQCSFSRDVWFKVLRPFSLHDRMPAADAMLALWWTSLSNEILARHRKEVNSLVILIARELWLERNARIFDKSPTMLVELTRCIAVEFEQWKRAKLRGPFQTLIKYEHSNMNCITVSFRLTK
jgi:hypothetical protein